MCRLQVEVPDQLQADLRAAMESAGIPVPKSEERWAKAINALKVPLPPPPRSSLPRSVSARVARSAGPICTKPVFCYTSGASGTPGRVRGRFSSQRGHAGATCVYDCGWRPHCCNWRAQGVWASMYNERAMLSMKKVGIDFKDIRMAVLVQRVVQARRHSNLNPRHDPNPNSDPHPDSDRHCPSS